MDYSLFIIVVVVVLLIEAEEQVRVTPTMFPLPIFVGPSLFCVFLC
jgi:hypothetical protein